MVARVKQVTDAVDARRPVPPRWPPPLRRAAPADEADQEAWGWTAELASAASQHRGLEGFQSRPNRAAFPQNFNVGRGEGLPACWPGAARVRFCFGVRGEPCGRRPTLRRRWERSCGAARTCVRQSFGWGRGRVGFRRHPRLARRTSGGKASAGLLVANGCLAAGAGGEDGLDPVMNKARVAGFAFCELPRRIRPEPGKDALAAAGGHKHVPASRIHMHLTLSCAARC